jgi:hypothetical protein
VSSVKGQPATASVVAYTWESDHFKEHVLASYLDGEQNPLFDKYVAPDKRTQVTVQEISP